MQEERNSSPDLGLGTTVLAGMGAIALVAVLFLLSPWNVSHIAYKSVGPMIEQERVTGSEDGDRIC